jgi:hypothetical protein
MVTSGPPSSCIDRRSSNQISDMRRQVQVAPPSPPMWNRQQGSLLAQVLFFGLMVQVVLSVILLHSLPTEESRSLILEVADATTWLSGNQIQPAALPIHNPLSGLIRSYPNGDHDPTQRRNSITFTTVPKEIPFLLITVEKILEYMDFDPADTFDAIHLCIPDRPMRFKDVYPTTSELQKMITDPRVIIHRLPDYGPMTRYLGPLAYEQHPESSIVLFDMDSNDLTYDLYRNGVGNQTRDLVHLVYASRQIDESAMWCNQGENFAMNEFRQVKPEWDLFPEVQEGNLSWNHVHFCRGVGGLLFKPKHFVDFWYNQSDYHESCFWDDDRWVSYQMERQGFPLKVVHVPVHSKPTPRSSTAEKSSHRRLGTLTEVNEQLNSAETCPVAWLTKHPDTYPTARVRSGKPWEWQTIPEPLSAQGKPNVTSELLGSNSPQPLHDLATSNSSESLHDVVGASQGNLEGMQTPASWKKPEAH